jgi:GNAT superfamily N-acetyltransferase
VLGAFGEDPAIECHVIRAGGAEGEVVGFFALDFDEDRVGRYAEGRRPCGLRNCLISSGHQGRGLGRAAIPKIRDLLHSECSGASNLYLTVNCRNGRAISSYLGAGFRDTGRLYHGGASGPQHVLRLPLG